MVSPSAARILSHELSFVRRCVPVILLVDDHAPMRQAMRSLLLSVENDFYECSDGGEAVELYGVLHPRCVLMDLWMREVDGITATRRIMASFPDARIIIVTGHDDPVLRKEAGEAGAAALLRKDELFRLEELVSGLLQP